ncbi:ABC transporter ATP-binding protein [Propioniciclava sinopodophylli]|uniref:ABC transporter ATP-binding protein n=1 Tax=Propioniciclava sinopodophylli TaxID=1837344 RepID=UPI0019D4F6CB|nr:ABC transporter ATP-binding protein [Propioniciclava sinopodophylli]
MTSLTLTRTGGPKIEKRPLQRTLALLRPELGEHRVLMGGGIAALLAEVVFRVLEPWPLKIVVDAVSTSLGADLRGGPAPASLSLLLVCGAALVVITGLRALMNYLATVAFALVGSRASSALRAKLFRHVQALSQDFHSTNRSADTVQRIVTDVGRLQEVAVTAGLPLMANLLTLVVMFVVMVVIDPLLSLAVVVAALLFLAGSKSSTKKITEASRKTRKGEAQLANTAQESLSSIKVVQAYGLEDHIAGRFSSANSKALKEGVRSRRLAAGLERRTDVIVGLATATILIGGGLRVLEGAMTPGDLVLFTTYLKTTMKPLRDMAKYTGRIAKAAASGERVADLMDQRSAVVEARRPFLPERVVGWVEFDHVTALYGDHPVLRDVDLTIRPGERIAVIGPSGSGKSTLVSLLVRGMDPVHGEVRLDGHPLTSLELNRLREQVSILLQEAVLFTGTIRDNIRYGNLLATDEEVEQAARAAQAHDFILAQPEGYDTAVGERGGTLSGGQRQRIAIARALLRDSPVVVLDEATTGLDPAASADVLRAIERLMEGRTTIAVTHDVKVALAATRVVWIEGGRVLFADTPERLAASNPTFRAWASAGEGDRDSIRVGATT